MSRDYSPSYSRDAFWTKVRRFARVAGLAVIERALQLWYTLQKPDVPAWAKGVIVSALGYFVSPIDAIPDIAPLVGYSDDLFVLVGAVALVAAYVDDEARAQARERLREWFGPRDERNATPDLRRVK